MYSKTGSGVDVFGNPANSASDYTLLASGNALNDPYIQSLGLAYSNPTQAQELYNLKNTNPTQYYNTVADKLSEQIIDSYKTNANYDDAYNKLQSLKDVAPDAYYKNQLDFLSRQVGWQVGQNTASRGDPVIEQIKELVPQAQAAGVSSDQITQIVNNGYVEANIQNQQRIINEQQTGGGGFNFGKDVMPGIAFVGMSMATFASGPLAASIGGALSLTGAAATAAGGAILGAGMGALGAAVSGGNIENGALRGAISGGAGGVAQGISSGLVGTEMIQSIADATNLSADQVSNIIANTTAATVAAAATGQVNSDNFLQVLTTNLAASGVGTYAGEVAKSINPEITDAAMRAVSSTAQVATNAALNGGNVQNAIMNSLPAIIGGYGTQTEAAANQIKDTTGTENVGLTSGAVDQTLQQGLVDPYINAAQDPLAALNARQNWTGNPVQNMQYLTNTMLDQGLSRTETVDNLATAYNVSPQVAENFYNTTVANNSLMMLANNSQDPIAVMNAGNSWTGDPVSNVKAITQEMLSQGLGAKDIAQNLQDIYQLPEAQANAYAKQLTTPQVTAPKATATATTKPVTAAAATEKAPSFVKTDKSLFGTAKDVVDAIDTVFSKWFTGNLGTSLGSQAQLFSEALVQHDILKKGNTLESLGKTAENYGKSITPEYITNEQKAAKAIMDKSSGFLGTFGAIADAAINHPLGVANMALNEYFQEGVPLLAGYGAARLALGLSAPAALAIGVTIDAVISSAESFGAGYQEAYLAQQCSISSLYSPSCPNYAQAYHDQQCSINPLYANTCQGYAQAYFNEQCRVNPLYDRTCSGYAEAYALANVVAPSVPVIQVSTTGSVETPTVSDPVVNQVISTPSATSQTNPTSVVARQNTASQTTSQVATQPEKKEEKVDPSRSPSNKVESNRDNAEADSEAEAEAKQTPKSKPSATPPSEALESLPFCSLEFEKAWTDWIAHRKEIRKPLKPTQIRKQLEELAAIGESRAIATINHTITKGWQGLREPDITQELFHNPKADEFFEIFRAIYEEHTGSDYPEAKSDFAALNGLLNAFPALTASEWRNALRWCWTTADTDRFADK